MKKLLFRLLLADVTVWPHSPHDTVDRGGFCPQSGIVTTKNTQTIEKQLMLNKYGHNCHTLNGLLKSEVKARKSSKERSQNRRKEEAEEKGRE